MAYCEDYPCCGHTPSDPCDTQWYDRHDWANDPHVLCDHENGFCEADDDEWDEDDWDDSDGLTDAEADAMTLAGAGWGTDEDYGYFEADYGE